MGDHSLLRFLFIFCLVVVISGWSGECGWSGCRNDCPYGSRTVESRCCHGSMFGRCLGGTDHKCCWNGCGGGSGDGTVESRVRYNEPSVHYTLHCISETQRRSCDRYEWTSWTGSFEFDSCDVMDPKDCPDAKHGEHGDERVRFKAPTARSDEECLWEVQTRQSALTSLPATDTAPFSRPHQTSRRHSPPRPTSSTPTSFPTPTWLSAAQPTSSSFPPPPLPPSPPVPPPPPAPQPPPPMVLASQAVTFNSKKAVIIGCSVSGSLVLLGMMLGIAAMRARKALRKELKLRQLREQNKLVEGDYELRDEIMNDEAWWDGIMSNLKQTVRPLAKSFSRLDEETEGMGHEGPVTQGGLVGLDEIPDEPGPTVL
ncbi:hypothetical protein CYMTET_36405 [Cymbomonas tetramitiformis]|uniref:Uncharacterized protein n=1 Tax=Cymbomonas tetramitiformis TaxID=36881 RepID=A0AAE0F7F9_9CHLO|nr:hypothetical protein CYMTET_36405 [Cymbomonas tetramitiformis]